MEPHHGPVAQGDVPELPVLVAVGAPPQEGRDAIIKGLRKMGA